MARARFRPIACCRGGRPTQTDGLRRSLEALPRFALAIATVKCDARATPRGKLFHAAPKLPILLFCCASTLAQAQEISGLGGALRGQDSAHTFAWEMDYQRSLGEHAVFSAGWINEGHLPGHHRDGPVAQIWWRTTAFDPRLSLAAGVGPYAYFDTVPTTTGDGSHDDHGIGIIASAAASWRVGRPLVFATTLQSRHDKTQCRFQLAAARRRLSTRGRGDAFGFAGKLGSQRSTARSTCWPAER